MFLGLITGIVSAQQCLSQNRFVITAAAAFIFVFLFVALTVIATLWRWGPPPKQSAMDPTCTITMDPRGHVHLPESCSPGISRALNIVVYFAPGDGPTREDIIDRAFENCRRHPRFRQTPKFNRDQPWNSIFGKPEISTREAVERHVIDRLSVETEEELMIELEEIESSMLLENSPEWMIYRITSKGAARDCIVLKFGHCIGDGLRLAIWAESEMSDEFDSPCDWGLGPVKGEAASRWMSKRKPVKISFFQRIKMNWRVVLNSLVAANLKDTVTPLHPANEVFRGTRKTFRMKPIPLQQFRQIADETKSTINDILSAITSSAIRRYCLEVDPDFSSIENPICRGAIAIGFPCIKGFTNSPQKLFNNFALVPFEMPIAKMDPKKRLKTVKKTLFGIKNTLAAHVISGVGLILSKLGLYGLQKDVVTNMCSHFTCVFSNVRGPPERSYYLGKEVVHVECSYQNYTNQLIFLSYRDMMGGTFTTDVSCIKDPKLLLDFIHSELIILADAVVPLEKRDPIIRRSSFCI